MFNPKSFFYNCWNYYCNREVLKYTHISNDSRQVHDFWHLLTDHIKIWRFLWTNSPLLDNDMCTRTIMYLSSWRSNLWFVVIGLLLCGRSKIKEQSKIDDCECSICTKTLSLEQISGYLADIDALFLIKTKLNVWCEV